MFLIGTLRTLLDSLENPPLTPEAAKRVVVRHATGLVNTMPIAYRERIGKVPGVEYVLANQWFGGIYLEPDNFFAQFAIDPEHFFDAYPEFRTETPKEREDFLKNRTASLAGVNLATRFGWKVGDRVTLKGAIFPVDIETTIAGLVQGGGSEDTFYFRWDYLNESVPAEMKDNAGTFVVRARSADDLPAITEAVDGMFVNSSAPTKTETEAAFVLGFMSMWGNVRLLVTSISTVVLFTVVLVAANTMAMSIRERTGEIAILKTLGFTPGMILGMTILESALIAATGALLGAGGAKFIYQGVNLASLTSGFIPAFIVSWETIAISVGIALAVALVSTFVPAYNASRMPIAVALRRRGQ
jgi:putative ABC transport system permease protein